VRIELTYARGVLNMGFDEEGRRYLIEVLQRVQPTTGSRHDHLMTKEMGGWELSVGRVEAGEEIVHQVDLGLLPPTTDGTENDRIGE
jgi:hypothetical protein